MIDCNAKQELSFGFQKLTNVLQASLSSLDDGLSIIDYCSLILLNIRNFYNRIYKLILTTRKFIQEMVRFKNRYILGQIPQNLFENERELFKYIRNYALENMGELFLAKISFSLQIKYFYLNKIVIRVPRQQCQQLVACLFCSKIRIRKISGTIRNIQKQICYKLRIQLKRELTNLQRDKINKIDYS